MLDVGATHKTTSDASTPVSSAMYSNTSGPGSLPVSKTPTTCSASSRYHNLSKSGSLATTARMGPEPIAKYLPTLICQPAYWLNRHAATGESVCTTTCGQLSSPNGAGETSISANPDMQIDARTQPASNPPSVSTPKSSSKPLP